MPMVNDERLIEACLRHRHVSGREWRHCTSPSNPLRKHGKAERFNYGEKLLHDYGDLLEIISGPEQNIFT